VTTDLETIGIEWMVYSIPRSRDTSELISHLRRDGNLTAGLKNLIADIMDGTIKATPKRKKIVNVISKTLVRALISDYKAVLVSGDSGEWENSVLALREIGYRGDPESKGQVTLAAKLLTCRHVGLTPAQLDEFLSPRAARKKSR
jgi:hypothetical protein